MTIKATGVPSYTSFYADVDGQLFEQPIQHNGKYKFVLKDDGPFATGLMAQFMRDQNSNSYDIYINIPNNTSDLPENIATLQITDGVLDSVLQLENGILNLPSSIPALNTATHFNTNGKNYATGVSIDLTKLTYYSSMPEIDNGNYGNVIPVNENNVEITLLDDNNDKTDVEHTITPYNPNANKRSIKAINLTKGGNTRDVTAKDIVGYIRVNIPPPTITNAIQNNGYFKFNENWNELVNGSSTDYDLNIDVRPILQNKTINYELPYSPPTVITADPGYYGLQSVTFNCTSEVLSTMEYPDRLITSSDVPDGYVNIQDNYKIYMTRISTNEMFTNNNIYSFFDGDQNTTWAITPDHQITIEFDIPKIINGYKINGGNTTMSRNNKKELYGSNDGIVWTKLSSDEDKLTFYYNNQTIPYKYYGFRATNSGGYNVVVYEFRFLFCNTYPNYQSPIVLENNKELLIDSSNNQTTVYLNPSTGYNGFTNAIITTNVPTNYINADIDSQNNNIITTRSGTFTIPSGYTGWNSFSIDVPSDVNNYNGYTAANPLTLYNNGTGTITIPENYTGLGTVHYNVAVSDQQLRLEQDYEAIFDGGIGQSVVLTPSDGYNGFENVRITIMKPNEKKEIDEIRFNNNFRFAISDSYFYKYTERFIMQPGQVVIGLQKANGFYVVVVFYTIQQTYYVLENTYYRVISDAGSVISFWLQDLMENNIIGGFLAPNNDTRNCYLYLDDSYYSFRDFDFNS